RWVAPGRRPPDLQPALGGLVACGMTNYSGEPGRAKFAQVLARSLRDWNISRDLRVLIIGGCTEDERILQWLGFRDIVNSNHSTDMHRLGPAPAENSL